MNKIVNPGQVMLGKRRERVFCRIAITEGALSITGVEGPMNTGDCWGGCGQIDMGYAHRNPRDNDPRYKYFKRLEVFENGWNEAKWYDFLEIWKAWHLNDMRSECEHQRKLGWTYEDHHNPKTFQGHKCRTCGYRIGSARLKEELPPTVIRFLEDLPATKVQPAWC